MSDLSILQSLIADRWVGSRAGASLASAIDGSAIHHTHAERDRLRRSRWRMPAAPALPALLALDFQQRAARLKALAAYLQRAQGSSSTRSRAHTGATRSRQLGRHRGRHRHAVRLCRRWAATSCPRATCVHEGPAMPLGKKGGFAGTPHPGAARRRGGAHQRLQLPDLGPAREVRAQLPGRHALHRQAGHRHQLPDRGAGAADASSRACCPRAACSW